MFPHDLDTRKYVEYYNRERPHSGIEHDTPVQSEAHFTERLTDTGAIDADRVHVFSAEAACGYGPFSLQGEYAAAVVDGAGLGGLCLNGFYVQASYFLTGEHRPYDTGTGIFRGVQPKRSFLSDGGWGAWELAGRYSSLDLNDGALPASARTMQDLTVGLNWYLSPNVRLGWNYIRSCIDGSDTSDTADIFLMRLQIAF